MAAGFDIHLDEHAFLMKTVVGLDVSAGSNAGRRPVRKVGKTCMQNFTP